MSLTPEQIQEQLSSVVGTFSSMFGANAKSATALATAERVRITQLAKELSISKDLAKEYLDRIKSEEDLIKKEEQRSKAIVDAMLKSVNGLKDFTTGALDSAQAAYTSQGAFTGASATLGLLGNTVKAITDVVSTAFSGIPVIGGLVTAAEKATALVVDVTTKVMQMQMDNAQRYVDTYASLSKTGLTFGGSLEEMRKSAVAGGIALEYYNKFVIASASDLAKMGGGMEGAAGSVVKMGKVVTDNNKQLLVLYGGYAEVNEALARFGAQAASAGFDTVKERNNLNKGAEAYLYNLKELTELTGLSADQLKSKEDERQLQADYQSALQELGPEIADRMSKTLTLVGSTVGDSFDKYGSEFFARHGQVISETNQQTRIIGQTASAMTEQLVDLVKRSKDMDPGEFIRQRNAIIDQSKDIIHEENKSRTALASLTRASDDAFLKQTNTITQGINASESLRNNLQKASDDAEARMKAGKGDQSANNYSNLLAKQNEAKMAMDELTAKNLSSAANLAASLYEINQILIKKFSPMFGTAVTTFEKAVDKLIKMAEGDEGKNTVNANKAIAATQSAAGSAAARNEVVSGRVSAEQAKNILDNGSDRDIDQFGGKKFLEALAKGDKSAKPVFGGPTATSKDINGGKETDYGGLNIGGRYAGEAIAGGPAEQQIVDAVSQLSKTYPKIMVNAFNDAWHQKNKPDSLHTKGRAADLNIPDVGKDQESKINELLSGLAKAKWEGKNEGGTGDHWHLEMKKNGGISNKPAIGGEAGPEAFVPLPDGRTIPVTMDNSQMISKLQELIDVTKDHADTSEKIHRAVA
jgi:hypothetical protein